MIFIDQRGTLNADPFLDCREIDTFTTEAVGLLTADAETEKLDLASVEACRKRWTGAGVDLAMFDTAENAADLAALRLALKIDAWHVYGVSYGTDLTQQYLRNYPEGIRSAVLDSIVPPNLGLVKSFWGSAADGYEALAAACQTQPQCAQLIPDLEGTLSKVVNDLNAKPQTLQATLANGQSVTAVVDGYKFANLVTARSLSKGGLDDVPAIIAAAAKGDRATGRQRDRRSGPTAAEPHRRIRAGPGGVLPGERGVHHPGGRAGRREGGQPHVPRGRAPVHPAVAAVHRRLWALERGQGSGAEPAAGPERHPDPDSRG